MPNDIVPFQSWFVGLFGQGNHGRAPPPPGTSQPDIAVSDLRQAVQPPASRTRIGDPEARAEADAMAPELCELAVIDFSEGGEAGSFLVHGWSHQEKPFIWAVDETSEIFLPDTEGWRDVTVELELFPCILPPYRTVQRLRLNAGGLEIGRAEIWGPGHFSIATQAGLDWGGLRRLTFIHPDGLVPADIPGEVDGRHLSVAFRRITFRGRRVADAVRADGRDVPVVALAVPLPARQEIALSDKDLILQFEGLGGTAQGCEFGLLQRQLGAEPLGLLRWTLMTADSLADALEADFAGVGTPEQTVLDYFQWDTHREYRTEDRRFLMSMHTWVREDEKPFDAMFSMMCKRLSFLRSKLLDDLAESDKIFVFKLGDRVCTDEQIARLRTALRRHGPNTLLYVRTADDRHPSGTVEAVQDGLLIGYISHFNQAPDGYPRPLAQETWLKICREAYRLWRASFGRADT